MAHEARTLKSAVLVFPLSKIVWQFADKSPAGRYKIRFVLKHVVEWDKEGSSCSFCTALQSKQRLYCAGFERICLCFAQMSQMSDLKVLVTSKRYAHDQLDILSAGWLVHNIKVCVTLCWVCCAYFPMHESDPSFSHSMQGLLVKHDKVLHDK